MPDTQDTALLAIATIGVAGAVTRRYTTPYGQSRTSDNSTDDGISLSLTGGWTNDRGFLGKPTDPGLGLTDVGARLYDAGNGMFLTPDPILTPSNPAALHGYTYSANDPVNKTDPTGLSNRCVLEGTCESTPNPKGGPPTPTGPVHRPTHHSAPAHTSSPKRWAKRAAGAVVDHTVLAPWHLIHGFAGVLDGSFEQIGCGAMSIGLRGGCSNAVSERTSRYQREEATATLDLGTIILSEGFATTAKAVWAARFVRSAETAANAGSKLWSPSSLADEVANATGGALKANKGGFTIDIPNGTPGITVRVMERGGSRTNYYRVSVPGKETYTISGEASTDAALTHMDIGESSLDDILSIIARIQGAG